MTEEKTEKLKIILIASIIVLLAVIILISAALMRTASENKAYDRYVESAQESIAAADYENALAALRKAAAIDATDDCFVLMAQCYENLENYDKAIECLRSMTLSNSAVSAKISSIEDKKRAAELTGQVSVGGVTCNITDTALVLNNRGLTDADISQIGRIYALTNLSLSGNSLTDLRALSALGGLTTLNLSSNSISDLTPLTALGSLRTLYLDNNPVTDLSPLYSLPSLTTLSIKGMNVSEAELEQLSNALPNCAINGAETTAQNKLVALAGMTFEADVTELDLSGRGITDISALSACTSLTYVNLSYNSITDISPLMDIPTLQTIDIAGNNVTDLRPLMGLTGLKSLNASSNAVYSTVPLGALSSLTALDLSYNSISDFSGLRKLKNLNTLNLAGTGFSDSYVKVFEYLARLNTLNLEGNPNLSGEAFDALQALIPNCLIYHSELVYSMNLGGSSVYTNTAELDLSYSGLTDLSPLVSLPSLQTVFLNGNSITDLYYLEFSESRRTISYLDLSSNRLTDISSLRTLSSIVTLNLSDNNISDVTPLYALSTLRELYIGGNPLSDEAVTELNMCLPNCNIVFR